MARETGSMDISTHMRYVFHLLLFTLLFPCMLYGEDYDDKSLEDMSLSSLLNVRINSAAKYAQTTAEAPSSVTIITSQDIENYGYETLADVLASIRGFYTGTDRSFDQAGVRGFSRHDDSNNRVLLQINGATINENIFGTAFIGRIIPIEPESIERIEIIRGPGSALYGSHAMFAVINIVTKKGSSINGPSISAQYVTPSGYGTSATYGAEAGNGLDFMISANIGDIDLEDYTYRSTGSEHVIEEAFGVRSLERDTIIKPDTEKYNRILSTLSYAGLSITALGAAREKDVPTAAWGTDTESNSLEIRERLYSTDASWDKQLTTGNRITLRGFYNRYHYDTDYPYYNYELLNGMYHSDALGERYGGELQYTLDTGPNNRIIAGTEYRNDGTARFSFGSADSSWYYDDKPSEIISAYLQDSWQAREDLSFTVGIRADKHTRFDTSCSPRLAVVYNPVSPTTLKLLHGVAYRNPNVYEVGLEVDDLISNNPGLSTEKIRTTEAVWEQRLSKHCMSSVSAYMYHMKGMVDMGYSSSGDQFTFSNSDEATTYGFEFGIDGRFDSKRSFYTSYCFQEPRNDHTKTRLTNSPAHLVKTGFVHPLCKWLYVSAECRYESRRKTVYGTWTDDYILTHARLSTRLIGNRATISIHVRNIFDTQYAVPGGYEHRQDTISQYGRNTVFKVTLYL